LVKSFFERKWTILGQTDLHGNKEPSPQGVCNGERLAAPLGSSGSAQRSSHSERGTTALVETLVDLVFDREFFPQGG
jgi:hypothetical protein